MTQQCTPGPWKARPPRTSDQSMDITGEDELEAPVCIATVYQNVGNVRRTGANARLIAKAPEMLDCLRELDSWLSAQPDWVETLSNVIGETPPLEEIQAILSDLERKP